ncbi:Uncharacterized protein HZ326_1174 [Fusarium oxysporum f. sp. albedinis]|nr:Uncharacterized protein HZ326_1174 [Fusarium oxysporum f. sp. albedinis]
MMTQEYLSGHRTCSTSYSPTVRSRSGNLTNYNKSSQCTLLGYPCTLVHSRTPLLPLRLPGGAQWRQVIIRCYSSGGDIEWDHTFTPPCNVR